jgi:dTDP-glucose 4,6-dehydratase
MRLVITGGAGFLGSHLVEHFLAKGDKVVAIDNFKTSSPKNIAPFRKNKRFSFIEQDVTRFMKVAGAVDAVLHFASPASPDDYLHFPIPTLKVGALGTHNALGLAKHKGAVFFLASTSEVYGDPKVNPQPETYWGNVNPIGPRGVYDEAKRFAEAITMAYNHYHGLPVRIVRIFNTYGPRMRKKDGRAVPNFITQALANKPITVYGKGLQTRSLCYVNDLVRGIDALLRSQITTPVNIGNPRELSILEIAETIHTLTGSKSKIVHKPLPVDDPHVRRPDITIAKTKLKWSPEVGLEEGLRRTIEYFRHG